MSNATQKLIQRDVRARQELRRGTVLTEPKLLNFDTAAIGSTVFVVDVDIGASRPIRNVIVKSATGSGGRAYAQVGKAVEIQRNAGGRWIVIGGSDRVSNTKTVQLLDESDETSAFSTDEGFTSRRRPYSFYKDNLAYGVVGYGNAAILDGQGNEVP